MRERGKLHILAFVDWFSGNLRTSGMEEELFYMYTSYSSALDDARMNRGLIIPLELLFLCRFVIMYKH